MLRAGRVLLVGMRRVNTEGRVQKTTGRRKGGEGRERKEREERGEKEERRRRGRSRRVSEKKGDAEKRMAYECGFNPFDDARSRLDVRFYLVAKTTVGTRGVRVEYCYGRG